MVYFSANMHPLRKSFRSLTIEQVFPNSILDSFAGMGEGGPAKEMMNDFLSWLDSAGNQSGVIPEDITSDTIFGGIYGKAGEAIE